MAWLDPALSIWLSMLASLGVLGAVSVTRSRGTVAVIGAVSCAFLGVSVAGTALWGWLLRDGLGPDAVESRGWSALARFLGGGTGLALGAQLCVAGLIAWVCVRRMRRLRMV